MEMNREIYLNGPTMSHFKKRAVTGSSPATKKNARAVRALAEAIILQSIEDLWCEREKSKRLNFFTGDGFNICSKIAGMNFNDQVSVLNLVKNASVRIHEANRKPKQRRLRSRNLSAAEVMV